MKLLENPPRNLFFTGKGGVGKTSLACATAIALAGRGQRVLLVSTDPASNLGEVLGVALGAAPTSVPEVPGLDAMNLDPQTAAEEYRARVLGAMREEGSSEAAVSTVQEQLSGACTTEVASFDTFAGLLSGESGSEYAHVIFDTAPTGHTLRLLALPRAWTGFLADESHDASCLGPHSGLTMRRERFAEALTALTDATQTEVVLVARLEVSALREAERTRRELAALSVTRQRLVLNGVFHASDANDSVARAVEAQQQRARTGMPDGLRSLSIDEAPLLPRDLVGLAALRALFEPGVPSTTTPSATVPTTSAPEVLPGLGSLIGELTNDGHGLVLVMGKGGVGKTTIAAAIAIAIADRGTPVHLCTTDPAAHVAETVAGAVPGLTVSRIDPAAETKAYVARALANKGASLDAEGRALLEEDLRSPCTEEVAVFHAFSHIVSSARRGIVVLDTAPTGHTLLLLDATGAYHREVTRDVQGTGVRLITPLMRLRDPAYTKVLLVTLPETTPVSETASLQADLRRAGVEPYAWVVNRALAASDTRDPLLRSRIAAELVQVARVRDGLAQRVALVPWCEEEPVGPERLRALLG